MMEGVATAGLKLMLSYRLRIRIEQVFTNSCTAMWKVRRNYHIMLSKYAAQ